MKLSELIHPNRILLDVETGDVCGCANQLADLLAEGGELDDGTCHALRGAIQSREELGATTIGKGVSVPHAYLPGIPELMVCFARLKSPLAVATADGVPVDLVFMLTGPESSEEGHLKVLARIVRLLHDETLLGELREAGSKELVYQALQAVEARHA